MLGWILLIGCENDTIEENGILKGTVSIGPICPVETDPIDPGCLPTAETFKAYPVYVWTPNMKKRVAQLDPELDGSFSMDLAPGDYVIDLGNEQNALGGSNLPQKVDIEPSGTVLISIEIDTGIR
jgi:hypothetical protein